MEDNYLVQEANNGPENYNINDKPTKQRINHKTKAWLTIGAIILGSLLLIYGLASKIPAISLSIDKKTIENIIDEKYSSYEIKDMELTYVDVFSSIRKTNGDHNATGATVILVKNNDQMTVHLKKESWLFGSRWNITSAYPDYGSEVPNDVYFLEIDHHNVGKAVDIDEWIEGLWIIPDEDGNLYTKSDGDDWYYHVDECDNIYKTSNGRVYSINKKTFVWEESDIAFSRLEYYNNYQKITKEDAIAIIKRFNSSYEE